MTRMQKVLAATAVAAVLVGAPTVAYAVSQGKTASATRTHEAAATRTHEAAAPGTHEAVRPRTHEAVKSVATKAPTARIVAPGEHVTMADGAEVWLTEQGKYWTSPGDPDPQFRSVVDGNIDLGTPGVSLQAEGDASGHYLLSGLYYGGKGTASRVTFASQGRTVEGHLLELAGKPGWGVWYAVADLPDRGMFDLGTVTVYDNKGRIYAQLK